MNLRKIIIAWLTSLVMVACNGPDLEGYSLKIVPPPSANGYPFGETYHSYPIRLQFNFTYHPGSQDPIPANPFIPLYRLRYTVKANPIDLPVEEPTPTPTRPITPPSDSGTQLPEIPPPDPCYPSLMGDSLDLYGLRGPGRVEVTSPFAIPPGVTKLRVCASLIFEDGNGEVQTVGDRVDFNVSEPPDGSGRYLRYRDGYLRGHLISAGRGLSWTWLKQYEPGVDPKDLLYNGRAIVVSREGEPDYHAAVYVPWIAPNEMIHGGDENPLLRGGLAMATFSLEHLATGNDESLQAALDLLRYVEASEWKDSSGNPTGFFLRSRWPGDKERLLPWYASIDEIAGMTLGLYYLHEALEEAGMTVESARVESLVTRLGTQLKDNFFFLVPPADSDLTHQLPQQRHKGWGGAYPYQWFLNGAFIEITGQSFQPESQITLDSDAWHRISSLPWDPNESKPDDLSLNEVFVDLELSAKERAVLSIQAIGVQMFWRDNIPIPVTISHPILQPLPITIQVPMKIFDVIPLPFVDIEVKDKWSQFNFPMLLHFFQLGMENTSRRDPESVNRVKEEMSSLIAGVLGREKSTTTIFLFHLKGSYLDSFKEIALEFLIQEAVIPSVTSGWVVRPPLDTTVEVGMRGSDADYYAAAVAKRYNLFNGDIELTNLLNSSILQAQNQLVGSLPIGKPALPEEDSCSRIRRFDPNPNDKLGEAFAWERQPDNRILGGKIGTMGVTEPLIENLWADCKGVLKEGAGLDYLLPTMLIEEHNDELSKVVEAGVNVPEPFGFRFPLPVCTSFPFDSSDGDFDLPQCDDTESPWRDSLWPGWPGKVQDPYEDNDLFENAPNLQCGTTTALTIDRSTLYSRGAGSERQQPVSGTYFGDVSTNLWSTDDIDYFRVNCDPDSRLLVEVVLEAGVAGYHRLVVDGIESTSSALVDGKIHLQMEAPARNTHLIKFTGDATEYDIHLSSQP